MARVIKPKSPTPSPRLSREVVTIGGQAIKTVHLPLRRKQRDGNLTPQPVATVWLYEEDHKRLVAMGVTERWFLNEGLVRYWSATRGKYTGKDRGQNAMVSRAILGLWPDGPEGDRDGDKKIFYRNGDKLNLLRHNLRLSVSPKPRGKRK